MGAGGGRGQEGPCAGFVPPPLFAVLLLAWTVVTNVLQVTSPPASVSRRLAARVARPDTRPGLRRDSSLHRPRPQGRPAATGPTRWRAA